MGRLIVVGNEKGGTGKTTVSVNLAALAVAAGHDTLLVDADPGQQSAARWAARRREMHPNAPQVRCVSLTGRGLRVELEDLARRYQTIVVDTGAEDSPELRAAATVADVLVIPVQPDSADVWTLPTMEAVAEKAASLNEKLRTLVVVNRVPYQAADPVLEEVRAWMAENVPNLPAKPLISLIGRTAYGRAFSEGMGVAELAERDAKAAAKAASEMMRLFEEVMR